MEIRKGTKVGIMIEMIVLAVMILLVLVNKPIPSLLSWIFVIGLVIALAGIFVALSKRHVRN